MLHVNTIIVDEVSMLSCKTIDLIDNLLQLVSHNNAPFGGKQMIFCGDGLQLPFIGDDEDNFFFYAKHWDTLHVMNLTEICYFY